MYQEVHFFAHENRLQYKNIRTVGTMRFSRHANVVPSYALCARKMRTYLVEDNSAFEKILDLI